MQGSTKPIGADAAGRHGEQCGLGSIQPYTGSTRLRVVVVKIMYCHVRELG
jgi:hypothetical protein